MNIQPVVPDTAASPPGIYSSFAGRGGEGFGAKVANNPAWQNLMQLSPEEQNAYAMANASGDGGFWGNVGSAVGTAAKIASPFLFATGAGALADAAGFGGAAIGGDTFAAPATEQLVGGTTQWAPETQLASDAGFGDVASGGAFTSGTSGSTAAGGLDTIGSMVQNVPEGMTATTYAQSLGYPTADAWLAAGAGTGAAAGAGAFGDIADGGQLTQPPSGPAIPDSGTNAGDATFAQSLNSGATAASSPSILDIVGKFMKSGGLAGQIGQALGLSPGTSSALGGLWSAGSGLYGLYQSSQLKKQAMKYAAAADPFGPYRSQYADQLFALTRDPSGITKMPGYEAGLQAVQRSMAAQGYNGSGNMMTALSKYGGDFYNNAVSQLSGLAGAGINPANGASIGLSGQAGGDNLALNSLGLIGKGLVGMR